MLKIQVLGKGYHPRIGYIPKWTPFWADKNTVGWLLATSTFRIRFFNPNTNKMEDMTRNNYIPIFNGEYSKPVPSVISKEVYEKDDGKSQIHGHLNQSDMNTDSGGSIGKTFNDERGL